MKNGLAMVKVINPSSGVRKGPKRSSRVEDRALSQAESLTEQPLSSCVALSCMSLQIAFLLRPRAAGNEYVLRFLEVAWCVIVIPLISRTLKSHFANLAESSSSDVQFRTATRFLQ